MSHITEEKIKILEETANEIRADIIEELVTVGWGHIWGDCTEQYSLLV